MLKVIPHINPLQFSTKPSSQNCASIYRKNVTAVTTTAFCVFIANPIKLSVGNIQLLYAKRKEIGSIKKIIFAFAIVLGFLYALTVFGFYIHLIGKYLIQNQSTRTYFQKVGKGSCFFGYKNLYKILYVLPQKTINTAPTVIKKCCDLLAPIKQKIVSIDKMTKSILNTLSNLFNEILQDF
jgi:hypothetical protein